MLLARSKRAHAGRPAGAGVGGPPPLARLADAWWLLAAVGLGASCVELGPVTALPFAAAVFVAAALRHPELAVFGAFAGILLDSRGLTPFRVLGLPLTLSKGLVALAVAAHVLQRLARRQPIFVWTPITWGVVAVLGSMVLSFASMTDVRLAYIDMAGVVMLAVLLHLVASVVDAGNVARLVRVMAAVSVVVLVQVMMSADQHGLFADAQQAWHTRSTGDYADPNAWATALLVVGAFLLAALAADPHRTSGPLILALLVLFPACLLQSMSRAGLLGLLAAAPVLAWALWPRRRLVLVAVVPLLLITPVFVNVDAAFVRYWSLYDPSIEEGAGGWSLREREALVRAAFAVIEMHPLLGVGVGNFRVIAEEITSGEVWKIAHNSYLTIVAEQGVPGIVSHVWLAAVTVRSALRAALSAPTVALRAVGRGYLGALIAFGAMAATLNLSTFAVAWFVFGVGLVACRPAAPEPDEAEQARPEQRPPAVAGQEPALRRAA